MNEPLEGEVLPAGPGVSQPRIMSGGRGGLLAAAMILSATAGGVHAEILDDAMGYRRPEEPEPKVPYQPTIHDLDRLAKAAAKRERKLRRNRG